MLKSISKSHVWCINLCSVLKYFKTMVYGGFMMYELFLNIHIEYGVLFFKKFLYLYLYLLDLIWF